MQLFPFSSQFNGYLLFCGAETADCTFCGKCRYWNSSVQLRKWRIVNSGLVFVKWGHVICPLGTIKFLIGAPASRQCIYRVSIFEIIEWNTEFRWRSICANQSHMKQFSTKMIAWRMNENRSIFLWTFYSLLDIFILPFHKRFFSIESLWFNGWIQIFSSDSNGLWNFSVSRYG